MGMCELGAGGGAVLLLVYKSPGVLLEMTRRDKEA